MIGMLHAPDSYFFSQHALLPMKAWINFKLTPSHNFVFSCDVIISSDLLIIDMHQQGSQFFIVSERASTTRYVKQKLKAHTIVQFHVAGKLFAQYVNYENKCWKLDSIARSLFGIRVHVPCTKLYSFVPKYLSSDKFQTGIFQSVDSLILLRMCTPSVPKYSIRLSRDFNK